MQPLEIALFLAGTALLAALVIVRLRNYARPDYIFVACIVVLVSGLVFEGYRWQMAPAYIAIGVMGLILLKRRTASFGWRLLGATPVLLLLALTLFLGAQMPVMNLPVPDGPYAVGTFDYTVTDESRRERHQPDRARTLPVNVWYPVNQSEANDYPVKPFWYEMYRGNTDPSKLVFGYLQHIDTHSHIEAPISDRGQFPVLVFNPGGAVFPVEQNTLLIEHLVSHGYVVFGIGHPYENRTTLPDIGTIRVSQELPDDVALDTADAPNAIDILLGGNIELWRPIWQTENRDLFNGFNSSLGNFMSAQNTSEREAIVDATLNSGILEPLGVPLTREALMDVFIAFMHLTLVNETWVADTRFVVDRISRATYPIANFLAQVDAQQIGVFGMSLGGSVAAAFCKVDEKCVTGINLDGTEFHKNWDRPIASPFLKLHHEDSPDNNFAITPPTNDLHLYTVEGTTHNDFMDTAYFLPLFQTLGMGGPVDGKQVVSTINEIVLNHFNYYMKDEGSTPFAIRGVVERPAAE
ncbi:MAG: hypothetical protein WD406_07490 [Pseudohongiellaceae bacterium]